MKMLAENRKARFNYALHDQWEAGLVLQGWEVKSAKAAQVSLAESFIHLEAATGELWLKNAYFAPYAMGDTREQVTHRNRKLLLHRAEIAKIAKACLVKGNTCVPLSLYLDSAGLIKLKVAVGTGKHTYDKKETIKQRDLARETAREIKRG